MSAHKLLQLENRSRLYGRINNTGKKRHLVPLYLGLENGKRKYHSKTIHGTTKVAEHYLNKIFIERDTTGLMDDRLFSQSE